MKTKLTTSLILLLAVICYLISGSTEHRTTSNAFNMPMTGGGDNFVIGALDNGLDTGFNYVPGTLGFNLWHLYTGLDTDAAGRSYPTGWVYQAYAPGDTLFAGKINYVSQVQGVLGDIKNQNMTALMMRPKIEWLCYGQRSDYQCENTSDTSDLWFYSFNDTIAGRNIQDTSQYGSDEMVRYCEVDPHQTDGGANWVVKRLKANTEQCQDEDHYIADGECTWYIKPRIRIDSNVAHNPQNPPVCKIKVIKEDGSTVLKEVIIKANDFLDENENYNGSYIEEYNFPGDTNLRIQGAWGESWKFSARGNSPNDTGVNKADIQVYWYGNCDMWIDYVRVDNDVADKLFDPVVNFDDWLEWEAKDIAGHLNGAASYRFYLELFEFNNIPCMKYVSRKLDSIAYANCGKHITLMSSFVPIFYSWHVPWGEREALLDPEHIKQYFYDEVIYKPYYIDSSHEKNIASLY